MNYYNEFDPNAAAWLRELIEQKLIPAGDVDERSIKDVTANDLRRYTQCHFFAGIGGWSYALQLAGWATDRPVWTGSCPCQCYSVAGKQLGVKDERDLWPVFFELIRQCKPQYVFGEQVENAIRHGWLDRVYTDLEAENYTVRAVVLGAHSVNAPHQRQRLYWGGARLAEDTDVRGRRGGSHGDSTGDNREIQAQGLGDGGGLADGDGVGCIHRQSVKQSTSGDEQPLINVVESGGKSGLADMSDDGLNGCCQESGRTEFSGESRGMLQPQRESNNGGLAILQSDRRGEGNTDNGGGVETAGKQNRPSDSGDVLQCRVDDREGDRRGVFDSKDIRPTCGKGNTLANTGVSVGRVADSDNARLERRFGGSWCSYQQSHGADGLESLSPWSDSAFIYCRDGKVRRIPAESILLSVADGLSERVDTDGNSGIPEAERGFPLCKKDEIEGRNMLLKGYGNTIVPELAAEFVRGMESNENQN